MEIPLTPGSPLKSAMKIPGTPGRRIDNPLSPTFREEQILEKEEQDTEKEQAKDLVCITLPVAAFVANCVQENQDTSANGEVGSSWCKLQLQFDRPIHVIGNLHHFQCYKASTSSE